MVDLFSTPIVRRKVRKGINAYQYRNGTINIDGHQYSMYTMTQAIAQFRKDCPAYKKPKTQ